MNDQQTEMPNQDIEANMDRLVHLIENEHLDQARKLARAGYYAEAEAAIRNAKFSEPGIRISAYLLLAKIYAQQGIYEKAVGYWNTVLQNEPDNSEAQKGLLCIQQLRSPSPVRSRLTIVLAGLVLIIVAALFYWRIMVDLKSVRQDLAASQQSITDFTREGLERFNTTILALGSEVKQNSKSSSTAFNQLTHHLDQQLLDVQNAVSKGVHGSLLAIRSDIDQLAAETDQKIGRANASQTELRSLLKQELQSLKDRLAGVEATRESRFDALDQRFDLVEENQTASQSSLRALHETIVKNHTKAEEAQKKVVLNAQKSLDQLKTELATINAGFDAYAQQIEKKYTTNAEKIKTLQGSVEKLDHRLEALKTQIEQLTISMDDLKLRLLQPQETKK